MYSNRPGVGDGAGPPAPPRFDTPRHQAVACALRAVDGGWRREGSTRGPAGLVARLGRRARATIRDAHLGRDEEAVIRAVVLGDRSGLSPEAKHAFRATAMIHAITVSGVHVAL